jgi:hypothetical protein
MTGDLKIKLVEIDGMQHVPPECMRLLVEMARHRDLCDQCKAVFDGKGGNYCATGDALLTELLKQPEVTWQKIERDKT